MLCGKNTVIRKVMRDAAKENSKITKLHDLVFNNVALVFTNDSLSDIRTIITSNKSPAAARVGIVAPDDCWVPAGPTGLDPGQTNFFQALDIATKIVKGAIEIMNPVHLIKKGEKVTPSQVSLLAKLDIKPFFFGMQVITVYEDGSVYAAEILDIKAEDLLTKFFNGVQKITAISLAIGVPNVATVPHSIARAFKKLVCLAVATEGIDFKEAMPFKDFLADPSAYAAKHGVVSAPVVADKKEAPVAKPVEKESSDEGDMFAGNLFGDD